jgi:hypothetical protein
MGVKAVLDEAERLVGPLGGLYGTSKRLLGFDVIKVWVQRSAEETRLNIYLEGRESITQTLESGRHSTHPLDLELRQLFEAITGQTWEQVNRSVGRSNPRLERHRCRGCGGRGGDVLDRAVRRRGVDRPLPSRGPKAVTTEGAFLS